MTPHPGSTRRIHVRWLVVGAIVWLILAASINLEQGQEGAAEWGTGAALAVAGLLILVVLSRVLWKAFRGSVHRIHLWIRSSFR